MEKMLTVVFGDESRTHEGAKALNELDSDGSISIHAEAVIKKNADGTVSITQSGDNLPIRTVGGTAIGALIGLLGGPFGLGVGAAAGALLGGIADVNRAGVDAEFLNDVSAQLTPGKWAIVSDISEEWVTPVDSRMEALGGTVFRSPRENVEDEQDAREVTARKAEIAQLKAEKARARTERKAKLQAKIDKLQEKLYTKLEKVKQRSKQQERETQAKVQALEKKAAKAKGHAKAALKARITNIRKESKKSTTSLKQLQKS